MKIDTAIGDYVSSQEQQPNTGPPQPRQPSGDQTTPSISIDELPSERSGQKQTDDSLSAEGVDKGSKAECEEPEQRVKELESERETLLLQVEEGRRGMGRLTAELEKAWVDKLQEQVEAKIREVEWGANQNTTVKVPMPSTSSNSRSNGGPTQLTPPSNNSINPEIEEERTHPMPPQSPSQQQAESARQQHPPFWSPSLHGKCARYCTCEPSSAHVADSTYNTPSPAPPANDSPQVLWVPSPPRGEGSYPVRGPSFPYRSGSIEPLNAQRHQAQLHILLSGLTPYGYVEPIGRSQHPLSTTIDVRNSEHPYPHENAVYNPQQGSPQFLSAGSYPYTDGNLFPPYRRQSPQYFDTLDYTGEYDCRSSATPVYGGESNDLRRSFWPQGPQPLVEDSEDGYFPGGFNPYLCQPH